MRARAGARFLLAHDGWRSSVVKSARIRDGLIAFLNVRKARVRILADHATIALKGEQKGLARSEFEYAISVSDAEEILRTMCDDRILEKYLVQGATQDGKGPRMNFY